MVRWGLENHLRRCEIEAATALRPRPVRSHPTGSEDFVSDLAGRGVDAVVRRGKYLWLILGDDTMITHLEMSGQPRVNRPQDPQSCNTWILSGLDSGIQLRFVDQHMFGGLEFVRGGSGCLIPHIAPDPFDPDFNPAAVAYRMRARHITVKRTTLGQRLASGIRGIYADEPL